MPPEVTQLTSIQLWLPVLISIALGLLITGLANRFRDSIQRVLVRRSLRMAGILLIAYGLVLAVTRLIALDLTTLTRTIGQLLVIGLGAYILWEGLELILTLSATELRERTTGIEAQSRIQTLLTLIRWAGGVFIAIISMGMALSVLNIDVTPLLASAGIAGLAISLGAQKLVQDLIAGILIIVEDQYHVGDVVDLAGKVGSVEHISLRATHLRDLNGTLHIIPHSAVTTVSNLTSSWARAVVDVGISYESDLVQAIEVLNAVGTQLFEEDTENTIFIETPTVTGPETFGDSAITLRLLARVKPGKQWDAQRLMRQQIKIAVDEAGIEIPFPQRVLYIRTPTEETRDAVGTDDDSKVEMSAIYGNVDASVDDNEE